MKTCSNETKVIPQQCATDLVKFCFGAVPHQLIFLCFQSYLKFPDMHSTFRMNHHRESFCCLYTAENKPAL